MLIELLTDIDLLSDADNDPLVLIESLTISEVLIESDVLVETLCDAAMLSDLETELRAVINSMSQNEGKSVDALKNSTASLKNNLTKLKEQLDKTTH